MQIAIIDGGIDRSQLLYHNLKLDLVVEETNEVKERTREAGDCAWHGTICARIIEAYAPEAEFISISIFRDASLKTDGKRLYAALSWCMENRIPLISLSIGTERLQDAAPLRPLIARLLLQGQIIVAASCNRGSYTAPACFGGVLGVVADSDLRGWSYRPCQSETGILLAASSRHSLADASGNRIETQVTNSYAAPAVTAAVHNILKHHEPLSLPAPQLYGALVGQAARLCPMRPDFIEGAYVLNLSGVRLLPQSYFFSCHREFTAFESFAAEFDRRKGFVFLPSQDAEENLPVLNFLKSEPEQWMSVLYAGALEQSKRKWLKHHLLWCENDCGILRWSPSKPQAEKHECPTMIVMDHERKGIELAIDLDRLFQEEGYQCIVASNLRFAYLYGFEYFPECITVQRMAEYIGRVYRPDLILFCVGSQDIGETMKGEESNYMVTFGDKAGGEKRGNESVLACNYDKADIDILYRTIIKYFT